MSPIGFIDETRALVPAGAPELPGVVRRGDPVFIRGWALEAQSMRTFDAIEVVFEDGPAYDAVVSLPRADVTSALNIDPALQTGFVAVVPSDELGFGPRTATVFGHLDGRRGPIGQTTVSVRTPRRTAERWPGTVSARVVIDPPRLDGAGPTPELVLAGWALDGDSRPGERVVVQIGASAYETAYGSPRGDVVEVLGLSAASAACGFVLRVPADEIVAGPIVAHLDDRSGQRWTSAGVELPAEIFALPLQAAGPALGAIDAVEVLDSTGGLRGALQAVRAERGDRVVLRGWAGTDADLGELDLVAVVDGVARFPIAERSARPDTAGLVHDAARAGFVAVVAVDGIAAGLHVVEIYVRGRDRVLLPTSARLVLDVAQ